MRSHTGRITIMREASAISDYCGEFLNLTRALPTHVDLRVLPDDRIEWKVTAPFNVELEGVVKHQRLAGGRVLVWRSPSAGAPKFDIILEIFESRSGDECDVHLTYNWEPLAGDLAAKALLLSGLNPQTLIPQILMELKRALETRQRSGLRAIVTDFFSVDVWSMRAQGV